MDGDTILLETEERMSKAIEVFKDKLRATRTGRASPGLVEGVRVEYYGSPTPLKQIANISAPEASMLVIKPFDPASLLDIEKAISKSDIGIHPTNDGKVLRLQIPPLSQERRKQLVQKTKDFAEETRVSIRNVRRDGNKHADGLAKTISEDELKHLKDQVQELTKKYEGEVDSLLDAKSKELMSF